ncbi:MAG: HNH endonuclease [Gammaproteobacteria bacterium]|nr:HNH endonuclease [Gammaproteobacteria bacterium]
MNDSDRKIRIAAFAALEKLVLAGGGCVNWNDIARGFQFEGKIVYFASRPRGIFKPRQMMSALSIKTSIPRANRNSWYDDQFLSSQDDPNKNFGLLRYEFTRAGPTDYTNRALRNAWECKSPLIYFAGVSESVYQPHFPVWIEDYLEEEGCVLVSSGDLKNDIENPKRAFLEQIDPSYSLVRYRQRNHQNWFSTRVRAAYGWRCAFSGLPVRNLLVGAHIVPDRYDGPASVKNGMCMSTLHHAAFDADLLGVDPDFRIHVSSRLRDKADGELLTTLKGLDKQKLLHLPDRQHDWPGRDFLKQRYDMFLEMQV